MPQKNKKSILEEMEKFLEYLAKNDHSENKREKNNLTKNFGKENYLRIYSLLVGEGRIGSLPRGKGEERTQILHITTDGLKFLEERQKEKRYEKHNKVIMFLTSMLVLTTIASFFKGFENINQVDLLLAYAIATISILIYFKYNKKISV